MLMEMSDNLVVLLTASAAAIAVGLFMARTAIPWFKGKTRDMFGITEMSRAFRKHVEEEGSWQQRVETQLDEILSEFKPNSGETVRDALNRIETNVDLNGERFRARMLDTNEMLFEADAKGNVIWVNRTLARKTRRIPGEMLGNGWINFVHPDDREAIRHAWHEAIRDEVELETKLRLISTESETVPVICKAYLMHDVNGVVIGWLVSFKENDVKDDRKKMG